MEKNPRKHSIVAFIPLRGGSKSIPHKNIKNIAGKPLSFWVIETALKSSAVDKIFVSTDSEEIKQVVNQIKNDKLEIISRSKKSATDQAATELAMLEFAKNNKDFQDIILIQATSPLLTAKHLNEGVRKFKHNKYDSLLSVVRQKRFIWKENNNTACPINYNPLNRPRRQNFDGFMVENGAFYITSRENLLKSRCRISGKTGLYEMPEETFVELDSPMDWMIAETLLIHKKQRDIQNKIKKIKMAIFDVDGVFTDGSVYLDETGGESIKFSRIDGKGIEILRENKYILAVISSEESEIVRKRFQKLQIKEIHLGIHNKLNPYEKLKTTYKLNDEEICFCGDDIQDIPVLEKVGLSICPNNARYQVKQICDYVSDKTGGEDFVRSIAEILTTK